MHADLSVHVLGTMLKLIICLGRVLTDAIALFSYLYISSRTHGSRIAVYHITIKNGETVKNLGYPNAMLCPPDVLIHVYRY